jgi:hypothetical protein
MADSIAARRHFLLRILLRTRSLRKKIASAEFAFRYQRYQESETGCGDPDLPCGSHTHTLVVDPNDKANVYIYVSGTSFVRQGEELAGCADGEPDKEPNTARFRIDVIKSSPCGAGKSGDRFEPAYLYGFRALASSTVSTTAARMARTV